MDKKRWKLQLMWSGSWRTILESDKRTELSDYARTCPDDLEMRIIDSTEEEKNNGRRRH